MSTPTYTEALRNCKSYSRDVNFHLTNFINTWRRWMKSISCLHMRLICSAFCMTNMINGHEDSPLGICLCSLQNSKTWKCLNVNDARLLSARPRWPLSPSEIQISLKVQGVQRRIRRCRAATSQLQKARKRERRGETQRGRWGEGFLWGTQQGHLPGAIWWLRWVYTVVFVCLFRLGFLPESAVGRAVCNNIPPPLPFPLYSPQPVSPALFSWFCFLSFLSFLLLNPQICSQMSSWGMAGVDLRWEWVVKLLLLHTWTSMLTLYSSSCSFFVLVFACVSMDKPLI